MAGVDGPAGVGSSLAAERLRNCHLGQVRYAVADGADKMHMGICVSVEALNAIDRSQAGDETLLLEQRQVSVHCTQRNVRIFRF